MTLAGSIMSLVGLMIMKHGGGAPTVTNSSVTGGIHQHDSVFDLSKQEVVSSSWKLLQG